MESVEFVKDLGLMHDVLEELTNLPLQLQERFCTITRADKLIKRTIRVVGTLEEKKEKLPKHQ
jgi:RNAse (barnase) inhibitor barstar